MLVLIEKYFTVNTQFTGNELTFRVMTQSNVLLEKVLFTAKLLS